MSSAQKALNNLCRHRCHCCVFFLYYLICYVFFSRSKISCCFPFTLPSHFNRHLCMPPLWPLVTIHYSYFLVVRTNTLLLFPFEPCMLLPSKIEKQIRTKWRTPRQKRTKGGGRERIRDALHCALPGMLRGTAQHHFACTYIPGTKRREKRVLDKGSLPLCFSAAGR